MWNSSSNELSEKLQSLQNRAVAVITKTSYDTRLRLFFEKLLWDTLSVCHTKQKVILVFKTQQKIIGSLGNRKTTIPFSWDDVSDPKMLGEVAVVSFNQVSYAVFKCTEAVLTKRVIVETRICSESLAQSDVSRSIHDRHINVQRNQSM